MKKDLLILILLIIPAFAPLTQKGYFTMHDDLQSMRQMEMDKCIRDGQFPCRWVEDMGYGYGYPLFNFYPPLPYLIGQLYRFTGMAYIDVVKAVGITGFIVTALCMYLLGRQFWGRLGGITASLFYTYAPYHSVDYYVRGAVNEFWAMAFYPAIFWTSYRLIISRNPWWIPAVSLSVVGLMLSHNPMLMIFTPVFMGWIILWWWKTKSIRSFPYLAIAAFFSAGLAAFFTLPVVFEQKYAHVETLVIGYFNYLAHYLDIRQIFFNINWGYGSSELGPADSMSFALGHLHWIIPLVVVIGMWFSWRLKHHRGLIFFLTASLLFSLFMTHSKSTFLWQAIKPLEFLQFPWRFMTLAVFTASFLSGAFALVFNRRVWVAISMALVIALNANYFQPRLWLPDMTDTKKFSGREWQLLVTSGIFDYLPIFAPRPPADAAGNAVDIVEGKGEVFILDKRTNRQEYRISIDTPTAIAQLQTYYFPGWRVWVNGHETKIDPYADKLLGRIEVKLEKGNHQVEARFTDTPVRQIANIISLGAWISMIGIIMLWIWKRPWKILT